MLKKMMGHVWQKRQPKTNLTYQKHAVDLKLPPTAATEVIKKLVREGYEAYLVGGAVRDLILGVVPKDFDVATTATPEQVRDLFKRSRIIGKRFPIVHILFGHETVEVSTFRSGLARQNAKGRIINDTSYGTLEQDAVRRDFTCNALYYDVINHQIIDFHQGLDDIQMKKLVMIGQPSERYLEDPVRILRAVRLSGKLGFTVDDTTAEPIAHYAHLLKNEPISRLFDELMKILFSGHAQDCLQQIQTLGINTAIHPLLSALQQVDNQMMEYSLQQTDQRLQQGKSVSMGFILAALFWNELKPRWQAYLVRGQAATAAMQNAISDIRDVLERGWGVPNRYAIMMREIWLLQPHFELRRGNRPFKLLAQKRFRAAYDFLLIRATFGEVPTELANWWTKFQYANEHTRNQMVLEQSQYAQSAADAPPKRKRKPRKRKPKPSHIDE